MLFDDYSNIDKKQQRLYRSAAHSMNAAGGKRFTAEEVKRLLSSHPELRLGKDPSAQQLAQAILADPSDGDLHELFGLIVNARYGDFLNSGSDSFWGNYQNGINYPPDFIPVAWMPNGEPVGITVSQGPRNIIFSGLTGSGKKLVAAVSKPALFAFQNMEYSCIHSSPTFGPLTPGKTGRAFTRLYFVEASLEKWYNRMTEEIGQINV